MIFRPLLDGGEPSYMSEYKGVPEIRVAAAADASAVAAIYNWYILHSSCTFEETPVDEKEMAKRIMESDSSKPWLVLQHEGSILGYAYASVWKARAAYGRSREVTVYLDKDARGQGLGRQLYTHLIDEIRKEPIHSLIASIALPNVGSVALHESLGFVKVGQFSEIGHKFGEFVDVGYWQLLL